MGFPWVYVNQVGGNDELIFDGLIEALDRAGEAIAVLPGFAEAVVTVDLAQAGEAGLFTGPRRKSPRCTRPWSWA